MEMQVTEIQKELLEFIPCVRSIQAQTLPASLVTETMLEFLQKVMGYNLEEDIALKHLTPSGKRPTKLKFNKKIKFIMTALPSNTPLDEEQVQQAVDYALAARTNVVMLCNGTQINFYAVDSWEGEWEIDPLEEINLLQDSLEETAQQLWPLAKKDCGRKIWVLTQPNPNNSEVTTCRSLFI